MPQSLWINRNVVVSERFIERPFASHEPPRRRNHTQHASRTRTAFTDETCAESPLKASVVNHQQQRPLSNPTPVIRSWPR